MAPPAPLAPSTAADPAPKELVLGTMNFGGRTDRAESERIVARALERGITRFDTANLYADGESERVLGRALGSARARVHLASKVGARRIGRGSEGLAPARVRASVEESLTRLGCEHLDMLYLHVPDPAVPFAETLGAIGELLAQGKIRAWGVSNYAAWQIVELCAHARALGLPPPARAQQLYNALVRQLDLEYFAFARSYGLATDIYNPLAGGLLTGAHVSVTSDKRGSRFWKNGLYERRYWSEAMFARRAELAALAASHERTLTALAYQFLAARPDLAGIVLGPGTVAHLDQALDALDRPLEPEIAAAIERLHLAWMGTDARYAR